MTEAPDTELLEQFQNGSEDAFKALVERYVALVHSVALRHTAHPQHAQDITQAVFIILARKAGTLGPKTILPGWLYRTARLTSANFQRAETRRIRRAQEAFMQSTLEESANDALWRELCPQLDEAMARLGASERDALVLRYFQNKSVAEVGTFLGVRENAAQQRVSRALEKLRKFFAQRGVVSTAAILAGAISANSVQAAPMGLAQTISAAAMTKGVAASASTLTLVKGALKIMAWTKTQTAIVISVVVLLAAGTTTLTVHQTRKSAINPDDFWATSYPKGAVNIMQYFADRHEYALHTTFSPTKIPLCSISGLLNQCMQVSGSCYLMDKNLAAGTVEFSHAKPLNGVEWLAAFENALQTNKPEWWDPKIKKFHRENLVLIRYPDQNIVLVLPPEKAARYQNLSAETIAALAKKFAPAAPEATVISQEGAAPAPSAISPEAAFQQESTRHLNLAKQWGLACRIFAQEHNQQLPENMAQLKDYAGNIPADNWEMVSGGRLDRIHHLSATILLREIKPTQAPDGTFVAAYTFADGHAQLESSPNGDFTALEQQRGFLVHPTGN